MTEINQKLFDLFGSIFLLSQKLQYITDYELGKYDLTTKQFLVLAAVDTAFDHPPTLNGSEHQSPECKAVSESA